jgi:hypothetical protein
MISNPHGVRKALTADYGRLFQFAAAQYQECALQPPSDARIAEIVRRCVSMDGALAGVIDGPSGIEASVGMTIEQFDYSDARHLRIKWLGVHPHFRRTNHAARLMDFVKWCQENISTSGETLPMFMDVLTQGALQAKMHLYLRSAPQVGASFAWGAALQDAYSQSHVGDDAHETQKRLKKAGDQYVRRRRSSFDRTRDHASAREHAAG